MLVAPSLTFSIDVTASPVRKRRWGCCVSFQHHLQLAFLHLHAVINPSPSRPLVPHPTPPVVTAASTTIIVIIMLPALGTNRQEPPRRSTRDSSSRRKPRTRTLPKPQATLNTLVHKPDVVTAPSTAAAPAASKSVSVQISIEVTQSMLRGALSIVAYKRGMFHDDCYEKRYYVSGSDQYTYQDYTNKVHNIADGRDNSGRLMIALKKGVSERVDRFHQLLVCRIRILRVLVTHIYLYRNTGSSMH